MNIRFALALGLAACPNQGTDLGPYCEDTPTDVALDEVTDLGFSAADVSTRLPATEETPFAWADGTVSVASLAFRPSDAARFVRSVAVYPDSGGEQPAIGVICEDRVEVDVSWDFATDDGAFDETFATPLRATAVDAASLTSELPLDRLGGTFDLADWTDETDYDRSSAWVDAAVGDGFTTGSVSGQVSGTDPNCAQGDTCAAWASQVAVGTWDASPR